MTGAERSSVEFRYSEEQVELRSAVRRLLLEISSEPAVRAAMQTDLGWDEGSYRRLARELGVVGLAVPQALGGSGGGLVELGVVLQEAGRALLCAPLLAVAIAARAVIESGDDLAAARVLPGIAAGTTVASLAAMEGGSWDAPVSTSATADATGWTVSGTKQWVLDAQSADLLVVSATTSGGMSLFLVDTASAGVAVTPVAGVDPTRRQGTVSFSDTPAVLLGTEGSGADVLARTLDVAVVLLAAEQLGVAERCLEMATHYAKERAQFGRAIGSFQAIKHKLANVLLEVEAATSAVMYAMWTADRDVTELPMVAAIAGSTCSEAALLAASESIQVHGGIGCTWEHPAHLYLKRATTDRLLFGDPQRHLERLADHLDRLPAGHLIHVAR
jgi:alkylation response protein AidB-like acyl-CoA dehydrogenase